MTGSGKRPPAYSLDAIKTAVAAGDYWFTQHADEQWGNSGRTHQDFRRAVARLTAGCFLKCVRSTHQRFDEWIDIYGYEFRPGKGYWFKFVYPATADRVKVVSCHHTDWPPTL